MQFAKKKNCFFFSSLQVGLLKKSHKENKILFLQRAMVKMTFEHLLY